MRVLPFAFLLLLAVAACAQPGGRARRGGAAPDGDEQAILDQVPTQDQAADQAERDIDESNAQKTLDEIRREIGGR